MDAGGPAGAAREVPAGAARREVVLLAGAVAAAALAPLAVHWVAGRTLAWFDTLRLLAPQRGLVDEALRGLRLPLWNPFLGGGVPLLADAVHGVLHPVSIAAAWLAGGRAADFAVGGHVALAAIGAALLARELGASRAGSGIAAVSYALSGYVLSMAGNVLFLSGAAGLPLCAAGLRRSARRSSAGALALGAACAALLALTGDVQAVVLGGAIGAVLAVDANGGRGLLRAVAAGALGLAAAGAQLLPAAAHFLRSARASAGWWNAPGVWALEPYRVAELALPGLSWSPDPLSDPLYGALAGPGAWPAGNLPVPLVPSVAVGLLPLALALAGLRSGRPGRTLGLLAIALLWGALGPALGAESLLGQVPLWRSFRYSVKLVGALSLVLALLSALGLDAVLAGRVRARALVGGAVAVAAAALGGFALSARGLDPGLAAEAWGRLLRGALHAAAALALLAGWTLARGRLGRAAGAALGAVAWCTAAAASPAALRPGSPEARLRAPGPSLAAAPPGPRIVTPYTREPESRLAGLDWIDQAAVDYAALGYPALNVRARLDSLDEYGALGARRLEALRELFGARWPAAARRYAVTHVLLDAPATEAQAGARALATDGAARLGPAGRTGEAWAVPHREWAAFAGEVRRAEGEEAALRELALAFVEGSERVVVEGSGEFGTSPGRVLSVERGTEKVRIEAESAGEGTLVVADAYWPGWEATVDGREAPIHAADGLVRAVRWPAGRHVLEMRYRPWEVRAGLALSAAGLLALGAGCARLRRRS
jgi:hypothetical protein